MNNKLNESLCTGANSWCIKRHNAKQINKKIKKELIM